jgi:SAM-dependent methyltransferase
MDRTLPLPDEQARLWNGPAGRAWVDNRDLLDDLFAPFEALLVDATRAAGATRVLDIGCGTGATTLAIADALPATGECTGVDVSEPMLRVARDRAAAAGSATTFVCADAQSHAFAPGRSDLVVSRFGVMFFADPVAAFANLRRAVRAGGALRCVTWRDASENPFMTTAERAAAPLLPDLPVRRPGAPGQFAFAEPARVQELLVRSGWTDVALQPIDVPCGFPLARLEDYVTRLGPVGAALEAADEPTRRRVLPVLRAAFAPYVDGDTVRFVAACWMLGATASAERAIP